MSLYSNDDPISLELPVFSSNREAVIENNLVIPIPDGFNFTQDPAIIGPERALIVVPDSYPLTAPTSDAPFALSVQSSPPDNSNDFKLRFMPNAADAMVNLLISPMLDPSIMTFRTGIRDGFGVFFQSFVDTGYHYNKVLAFIAADHKLYIAHLFWNNGSERCRERACTSILCVDFGSLLQKESGHAGDGGAGNTPCVNRLCGNPRMAELQQRLLLPDALWLQRSPHDVCIGGCDIRGGKTVSAKSGRA